MRAVIATIWDTHADTIIVAVATAFAGLGSWLAYRRSVRTGRALGSAKGGGDMVQMMEQVIRALRRVESTQSAIVEWQGLHDVQDDLRFSRIDHRLSQLAERVEKMEGGKS